MKARILVERIQRIAPRELSNRRKSTALKRTRLDSLRDRLQNEIEPPVLLNKSIEKTPTPNLRDWLESLPESTTPLVDLHGRHHSYLRISLTERCNLRCTYCMPPEGVQLSPNILNKDEILKLASVFAQHGVTKFRLTGGEPTLRSDLLEIVQGLNTLGPQQIGMTTNGVTLARHLDALVEAGMSSINISLDTLDANQFSELTRRPAAVHNKVLEAIRACHEHPQVSLKINCVVQRDVNDHQVPQMVEYFDEHTLRFIEYMPFAANGWDTSMCVPYRELLQGLPHLQPLVSSDPSDTTKWYQGHRNKIGFITSMTNHFCDTCNRLRLTANGQLKVCLFGTTEVDLGEVLRQYPDYVPRVISYAVRGKHAQWGGHGNPVELGAQAQSNRPMTTIGGWKVLFQNNGTFNADEENSVYAMWKS